MIPPKYMSLSNKAKWIMSLGINQTVNAQSATSITDVMTQQWKYKKLRTS